jgi:hypothetical protein
MRPEREIERSGRFSSTTVKHVIAVHQVAVKPFDETKPPKSLGICHSKTFTLRYCTSPNLSVRWQPRIPSGRVVRCSLSGRGAMKCMDNLTNLSTTLSFNRRLDDQRTGSRMRDRRLTTKRENPLNKLGKTKEKCQREGIS